MELLVGEFLLHSWLGLVEEGAALLCFLFAPNLQHRQVEDGQFVHNLLDNWNYSRMGTWMCLNVWFTLRKSGRNFWVMSWCKRSFVALLVGSNSL